MKSLSTTLLLLSNFVLVNVFGQDTYLYTSDCTSWCSSSHVLPDENPYLIVSEYCETGGQSWMICEPENDTLLPNLVFSGEAYEAFVSSDNGFYILSLADEQFVLHAFDNGLNQLATVPLELSPTASVREVYLGEDYLLIGYFDAMKGALVFGIARFDLNTGALDQSVLYTGVEVIPTGYSTLVVDEPNTVYMAIGCGWRFKINLQDLNATEVLPLPIGEPTGEEYNPCYGFYDVLRPNPNDGILLTAVTAWVTDELYVFDFGYDGDHLATRTFLLADGHSVVDHIYESNDTHLILARSGDSTSQNPDMVLYKMSAESEFIDSLRIQTPDINDLSYRMLVQGDTLHLLGWSRPLGQEEGSIATYITVDLNSFGTGVAEVKNRTPVFIHTDEEFGFSEPSTVTRIELYDLTGTIVHAASDAVRLQKSDFLPGTYVVKAYTTESVHSYRVVVH